MKSVQIDCIVAAIRQTTDRKLLRLLNRAWWREYFIARIDLARLTQEETADLMHECIQALPDDMLFEVLKSSLSREQKNDLREIWHLENDLECE